MVSSIWETCMLVPGFSRTECASWVQALGSIAAIAGAFAIAFLQAQHQRDLDNRRHAAELRERYMTGAELVRNFQAFLDVVVKRAEGKDAAGLAELGQHFLRVVPVFTSLSPSNMPSPMASKLAGLQFAVMMVVYRFESGDTTGLEKLLRQLSADCEATIVRAHALAAQQTQRS